VNVNWWNVFCSQELIYCMMFIPHWHYFLTLCHFHGCNSEMSNGRTMQLHTQVWGSLIKWMQSNSLCYVGLFGRNKMRHYFSAQPHNFAAYLYFYLISIDFWIPMSIFLCHLLPLIILYIWYLLLNTSALPSSCDFCYTRKYMFVWHKLLMINACVPLMCSTSVFNGMCEC
jgi:hypothetical protein